MIFRYQPDDSVKSLVELENTLEEMTDLMDYLVVCANIGALKNLRHDRLRHSFKLVTGLEPEILV